MKRFRLLASRAAFPVFAAVCAAQSGTPLDEAPRLTPSPGAEAAPAKAPEKRAKGPTEITAREASFDNRTHEAGFTGAVLVKDPEFSLTCERLSVYLKKTAEKLPVDPAQKEKPGGGGIEKAIAEIDVVITQEKRDANGKVQKYLGRAKKAVFDNTTGIVTLSGWPQISHNEGGTLSKQIMSREESCVIVIDRAGRIDVRGYHTTTLQPTAEFEQTPR